ncbi:MAG: glycosyltransferase family 39 protein, partial [Gemmatimonadota bacterium]|nr:glycosyltransferase family 39 protein [Gemmatimonadota bacterium]
SALSFRIFGVSEIAYRIPSTAVFLLGVFSTYRLAARYGGAAAGRWSAGALATCQGAFLMNHDVRTDTMLLGFVAFALWQMARFLDRPRAATAVWLGLGLGASMLTKGLIGLMVPLLGAAAHIATRRSWRRALRPEWLLAFGTAAALLAPMAVGLVRQHGVEGLRFHFWTQGFGRILDENIWGDAHGPFFFIPQLLWTFLPWTLFLGAALWTRGRELRASGWKLDPPREALTLGAFLLAFVGLSLSRSKLPHYLYVTLPAAAVLAGTWIAAWLEQSRARWFVPVQAVLLALVWIFVVILVLRAFPPSSPLFWAVPGALIAATLLVLAGPVLPRRTGLLAASVLSIAGANVVLNGHVYPRLFTFQATSAAGRLIAERDPEPGALVTFRRGGHALDFHARETAVFAGDIDELRRIVRETRGTVWGLAGEATWREVRSSELAAEAVADFRSFPISKLTVRFLDPATRDDATSRRILFRIE